MVDRCLVCGKGRELRVVETYCQEGIYYTLHKCEVCLVEFWVPFKNPGSEWYEKDQRYKGSNDNPPQEPTRNHKKALEIINKTGKVLDIGCGTGNFLNYARKKGWEIYGFDFDNNAINAAKNHFLLPNVEVSGLKEYKANYPDRKFDLITFFDVFEHIDDHKEFLATVKEMVVPQGHIAMSMPYGDGSIWLRPYDYPPRHLTRWNRESLSNILQMNGFRMVRIVRLPATFSYIVLKLRFRYGTMVSVGIVEKFQRRVASGPDNENSRNRTTEWKIKTVRALARLKDLIIFGLPALVIWLYLKVFGKIYITLFAIAQKE